MRILFVADGRSPIALNWIEHFISRGDEVHLVSTFPGAPKTDLASQNFVSIGFSQAKAHPSVGSQPALRLSWLNRAGGIRLRTALRQWIAPLDLPKPAQKLKALIVQIKPDLVHAMRIPYEGMLAAVALKDTPGVPLLVSVWGNDFTLHANATPLMRHYTRLVMKRANALHTDCGRDRRLAYRWGYSEGQPVLLAPGNGGVRLEVFHPPEVQNRERDSRVINPRGFRAYVRNDVFFRAIPLVLKAFPETRFICPDMQGQGEAERWVNRLGIDEAVSLLPKLSQAEMASAFRRSGITVSLTTHDGTPNTLLEAMACGCFPIVGDLESIREWITPEINGLLVNPAHPPVLAEALIIALSRKALRDQAAVHNQRLIRERAEYHTVMERVEGFYRLFV